MSVKVEFSFDTLSELQDFVNATPTGKATGLVESSDKKITHQEKVEKAAEKVTKPRGPRPTMPEVEAKTSEPEEKKEPAITYDYVAKATTDTVKAVGRDKVVELLNELGAATAKELAQEQWSTYMKRCGDLIKSKEAELA